MIQKRGICSVNGTGERTLHCVAHNFNRSLRTSQTATFLQLSELLGQLQQTSSSELVPICKGSVIFRQSMFSLQDLGVFKSSPECKLPISQRPAGPTWLRITTLFLCSSSLLPCISFMHVDSSVANVKMQLREHLRCPVAVLCLHLADGAALPDTLTLRDLGFKDSGRLYCRVRSEEPKALPPSARFAAADGHGRTILNLVRRGGQAKLSI